MFFFEAGYWPPFHPARWLVVPLDFESGPFWEGKLQGFGGWHLPVFKSRRYPLPAGRGHPQPTNQVRHVS
jgi:hypothetical protein